jgi:hypothetical protein
MWLTFAAWLMGAILCGVIDHIRQSSVFSVRLLALGGRYRGYNDGEASLPELQV